MLRSLAAILTLALILAGCGSSSKKSSTSPTGASAGSSTGQTVPPVQSKGGKPGGKTSSTPTPTPPVAPNGQTIKVGHFLAFKTPSGQLGCAYTKDPTTICYELFRDIRRLSPTPDERTIVIGAHPNVASLLADEEADSLAEIERERQVKVVVKPDPTLHIEQYDIVML